MGAGGLSSGGAHTMSPSPRFPYCGGLGGVLVQLVVVAVVVLVTVLVT